MLKENIRRLFLNIPTDILHSAIHNIIPRLQLLLRNKKMEFVKVIISYFLKLHLSPRNRTIFRFFFRACKEHEVYLIPSLITAPFIHDSRATSLTLCCSVPSVGYFLKGFLWLLQNGLSF